MNDDDDDDDDDDDGRVKSSTSMPPGASCTHLFFQYRYVTLQSIQVT
jgi:hypothetical protein